MSLIIPYKEKELYDNEGAFIKPDGEIVYTYGLHESFSREYCDGQLFKYLLKCIDPSSIFASSSDCGTLADWFEVLKRDYNYTGTKEEIDEYSSSKLTKEQLKLYKLWLDQYEFSRRNLLYRIWSGYSAGAISK